MAHFLQLAAKVSEATRSLVRDELVKAGLDVKEDEHDRDVLIVEASFDLLISEAEALNLERPLARIEENVLGHNIPLMASFKKSELKRFHSADDPDNFFSPADKTRLTWSIMRKISVPFQTLEILGHTVSNPDDPFILACTHSEPPVLNFAQALHESKTVRQEIEKSVMLQSFVASKEAVTKIRNYFGEEVAMYFVWMDFFGKMLLFPALFGIAYYILRPDNVSVEEDPFMPVFSAFMALWSILYLVLWRCHCSHFSLLWNTYEYQRNVEPNRAFKGFERISPVTDKKEIYFSNYQRALRYLFSFAVMLVMVGLAVIAMTISLNLNGYVTDRNSPIYIAYLASFAAPGGIFAADSPYFGWVIPAMGHTIAIGTLNHIYSSVAVKCTDYENHMRVQEWKNSVIGKRVIFEALNCFIAPLYITFYQMDVVALHRVMIRLFWCDEFRRLATEAGLPFLAGKVKLFSVSKSDKGNRFQFKKVEKLEDVTLEHYEQFADYLEMVIQFGYVTLFAAAVPLASLISIIFIMVETRSDIWRLLHAYRRPRVRRACDIGVWFYVMLCMVGLSMLTNSFIAFVSSNQMDYWLPSHKDNDVHSMVLAFSVEHFLLMVALLAHAYLPKQYAWVKAAIDRRAYKKRVAREQAVVEAAAKAGINIDLRRQSEVVQ
ncbi:anoctamin-8-like [Corticium candelabrum]|uniref:anoctamin-8-like n=1 Tax=Corticium candelabrum TaxID=121492 RepID=UPI002E25553B|nr:anoctamin-8-like [Corticium candelabrum]